MNKYKICVYAVCRDEEQFVDRFMDCLDEADMVIIGDTGSSDNTAQKFRDRGAIVYDIPIKPWRFDKARNEILKHIPNDVDICFSLDVDEVLNKGWRKCIENSWQPNSTLGWYHYLILYQSVILKKRLKKIKFSYLKLKRSRKPLVSA